MSGACCLYSVYIIFSGSAHKVAAHTAHGWLSVLHGLVHAELKYRGGVLMFMTFTLFRGVFADKIYVPTWLS